MANDTYCAVCGFLRIHRVETIHEPTGETLWVLKCQDCGALNRDTARPIEESPRNYRHYHAIQNQTELKRSE